MSGKPAARMGDGTAKGGPIIQGSLTVLIGSQGGVACSACPGGSAVGSPVNPQLGAKVLLGAEDLDFVLPGALPVVWQRQYSSYVNAEHGALCTLLGHGWHLLTEISLELKSDRVLLFDAAGRAITFEEPLALGEQHYSASEDLWLMRGGKDPQGHLPAWASQERFAHVSADFAGDGQCILAASGTADILWVFSPAVAPVKDSNKGRNANPSGDRWHLIAKTDRFGRSQRYRYSEGEPSLRRKNGKAPDLPPEGKLIAITDGAGRRYGLHYKRIHTGEASFGLWGEDDGWRLSEVELERDLYHFASEPIILVRYGYDVQGQLISVHDRAGELVREFKWERRRISAHRYRDGPWHTYRYAGEEPNLKVTEHGNEKGLTYRFAYHSEPPSAEGKPRSATVVTDSLGRVESYRFEGEAGLERLIEHRRADGTVIRHKYDGFGRLIATTDPLGRVTQIRRDAQGNVTGVEFPGRIRSAQEFDNAGRLMSSTGPTGIVTRYYGDAYKRLIEIRQSDGSAERYHYPDPKEHPHTCDKPVRIEDAKGGIKHLKYDSAGQLTSYTDCSGHTTQWKYNRWGEITEATDPLNHTTKHERDNAGRITATRLPNGQIRRYKYDNQGNLTRIEPDANTPEAALDMQRDLWGRLLQTTQGGLTLKMQWDIAGRPTTLINENTSQSQFTWDAMDRLIQETGFDGREQNYRYDPAGQLTQVDDGGQTSRYRWDDAGRLMERQIASTEAAPAQSRRYEWDEAGQLNAVSVYLIAQENEQTVEQLQSSIEIKRDALGRITGEVQRLYQEASTPAIEYEHCIAHQLDKLGSRQASDLQGIGGIGWLLYGSGYTHGLIHNGEELVGFERDALHRETRRCLHGLQDPEQNTDLHINRWRDSLGRLKGIRLERLEQVILPQTTHPLSGPIPPTLIGQIAHRQYHYDALGQLIALQTPNQTFRYGYDAAGRLRAQTDGQTTQRWDVDPAGNRLPGTAPADQRQQEDWVERVYRSWKDPSFNPLGEGSALAHHRGPVDRWLGNRIGHHQGSVWRYDRHGNRVEQVKSDGERQHLFYDGGQQLTGVQRVGSNDDTSNSSRYIYDALGRRLKKTVKDQDGKKHITYYGWDGDRLAHTERVRPDGSRQIEHTVYEPGSFTPLVRLSATTQGAPHAQPHLLVQMTQAGTPADKRDDPVTAQSLEMMQSMISAFPEHMQKEMEKSMKHMLEKGPSPTGRTIMSNMGIDPDSFIGGIREGIKQIEQEKQTPVEIHFYHCDHLGTPIALTDRKGQIVWAARYDPWGNIEEEFNPYNIEQNIRLPGQHHDRETGLYYNRHRYYDPKIGAYINQDPIGLMGGVNLYRYPVNPLRGIDPWGLSPLDKSRKNVEDAWKAAKTGEDALNAQGDADEAREMWDKFCAKACERKEETCERKKSSPDPDVTASRQKIAEAAGRVADTFSGPVSFGVEHASDGIGISNAARATGVLSSGNMTCYCPPTSCSLQEAGDAGASQRPGSDVREKPLGEQEKQDAQFREMSKGDGKVQRPTPIPEDQFRDYLRDVRDMPKR
jgi:RHS repeat-associated protein